MANLFKRLFGWLSSPWVWIPTVSIVGVGVVTGVLGFVFDRWLLALIGALAILLIVLLAIMVRMLVGRERDERLDMGLEDEKTLKMARSSAMLGAADADLKTRFRTAMDEIRGKLGRGGVYEVPWLLVIGGLGSGKSSLLNESGLDLPAQYAHSRVFGPTRSCDFVLFNEAIALDTAGRYFARDAEVDQVEWQALLGHIRSARPDCAVNGVIYTIPASSLLTLSPAELEEEGRMLRRRLNEIRVSLGVDAPIYVVATQSDLIEGFVDFASGLPPQRLEEAFGWTNDQRRLADPEQRIDEAFSEIRAHLDGLLPEMVMREPDPSRKRRMLLFPQELETTARGLARLVGAAFRRDIYNVTPFLRGVYFTSAQAAGETVSPTLHRLGQDWARTQHGPGTAVARYLRDLFLEVIVGDEELAMPESRIGPRSRRAILGLGGVIGLGFLGLWTGSFVQNYRGTHEIAREARLALSTDPTIHHVNGLRESIERNEIEAGTYVNRIGFGMLGRAVDDAKVDFVAAFKGNFDELMRQNLDSTLRRRDDTVFRAAVTMAEDLEYLASAGRDDVTPPDLEPYMPRRVKDKTGYHEAYRRFVQWMRPPDREELLRRQRDSLSQHASRILDLGKLERQTETSGGRFGSVRYADVGLQPPDANKGIVPGIYTVAGYDGLFRSLVGTVEQTGALPPKSISELRRRYIERYDRAWRLYLLGVPTEARVDAEVRKSPHLSILQQIQSNTAIDLDRATAAPGWIDMVAEVFRAEPLSEEDQEVPPYLEYRAALDNVAIDVENAAQDPDLALTLAQDVAQGKPNSFEEAIQVARRTVPSIGDSSSRTKVRDLLEAPILDGFSAVLASARKELDRRWLEQIAGRFGSRLTQQEMFALYNPNNGVLAAFVETELDPFLREGSPRRVLGERAMQFGPGFLLWMQSARALQRSLFAGTGGSPRIAVRLRGVPATLSGADGLRVKRRDLTLVCPDGEQSFVYREGSGDSVFNWTSACQTVTLRIVVGGAELRDREIRREWTGPFAFPEFLQDARSMGAGVLQWDISGPEGMVVHAKYKLVSGQDVRKVVHRSPPESLGS